MEGANRRKIWLVALLAVSTVACRDAETGPGNPQAGEPVERVMEGTQPANEPAYAALLAEQRDPDVPDLPFVDNPDPALCGIPTPWGDDGKAYLSGTYRGELVQEDVLLYESHLRLSIVTSAPHGSEVLILLYQQNPEVDYYLVKVKGAEATNEGWVPGPFVSFVPVASPAP